MLVTCARGDEAVQEERMSGTGNHQAVRVDHLFTGPGARADQWRNLVQLAEAWSSGSGNRDKFEATLAEMAVTEGFHAYPGPQLMNALRERAAENDARATTTLARLITRTLLTRSFRQNPGDWEEREDGEAVTSDVLPPALGRSGSHRPYFEVLIVTGTAAIRWPALGVEWRRLRRAL
jgi:arginine decarboxylase